LPFCPQDLSSDCTRLFPKSNMQWGRILIQHECWD
jgi:hypothetical protein